MRYFDTTLKSAGAGRAQRLAGGRIVRLLAVALSVAAAMTAGLAAAGTPPLAVAPIYVTPQAIIDSTRQIAEGTSNAVNDRLAPSTPDALVLQYASEGIAEPAADAFAA